MNTVLYMSVGIINIKPTQTINTMRRLNSFCVCNCLKNNVCKLQGGYYFINSINQFQFIGRTLSNISFSEVFNLLKS